MMSRQTDVLTFARLSLQSTEREKERKEKKKQGKQWDINMRGTAETNTDKTQQLLPTRQNQDDFTHS